MNNKPIYVTQPSLPPLAEYIELLEDVWETGILTHNGPKVVKFEEDLKNKLGVDNISTLTNGTIALQVAIRALEVKGEIITTPFSWVATISAIKYEDCTPVFCDIDPETFNIDVNKIEELITDKTVAIMPVHVFGTPCNVEAIKKIAEKHNLKVIYDAAHALGSTVKGESVLNYGDVSATSMHGTKLLNTAEGGACITSDIDLDEKIKSIRFFGHDKSKNIVQDGFNGKMTEIHASLGLANLKYFDAVLEDRKLKYKRYHDTLKIDKDLKFQKVEFGETNYSYFPVVFETEQQLLKAMNAFNNANIFPRRYFYPSLNNLKNIVSYSACPVSEDIASRIICLPLYFNLTVEQVDLICQLLLKTLNTKRIEVV
ncbi:DegT/DnrJ/EryC1/StrS family aminotransferase [Psychroserpens sp.]|uniref:DegT/DnrJ/EryC1/StrS family aminotransferase n=1 Tax=Psychroserpens sp. TaxID=2020870 RepID=UPI0038581A5A